MLIPTLFITTDSVTNKILATGHHSIVRDPSTDTYYIAYHRFAEPAPSGISGWDRGYNREVCIDKLAFNEKGFIIPIVPTF